MYALALARRCANAWYAHFFLHLVLFRTNWTACRFFRPSVPLPPLLFPPGHLLCHCFSMSSIDSLVRAPAPARTINSPGVRVSGQPRRVQPPRPLQRHRPPHLLPGDGTICYPSVSLRPEEAIHQGFQKQPNRPGAARRRRLCLR
jgi:hypothetical protein